MRAKRKMLFLFLPLLLHSSYAFPVFTFNQIHGAYGNVQPASRVSLGNGNFSNSLCLNELWLIVYFFNTKSVFLVCSRGIRNQGPEIYLKYSAHVHCFPKLFLISGGEMLCCTYPIPICGYLICASWFTPLSKLRLGRNWLAAALWIAKKHFAMQ